MLPRTCSGTATNDVRASGIVASVKNRPALVPCAMIGTPCANCSSRTVNDGEGTPGMEMSDARILTRSS
jgi:hypothetical protein